MNDYREYSAYLNERSSLGAAYRKLLLYPRLCQHLTGRVLDIGCGIGDMLKFRAGTIGVDVNPFNVDVCISRGLSAQVMKADVLPFADGSFDSALLDNVLEHIQEPEALLAEIGRVICSRGRLVVGVPGERGQASDPDHKVFYDEVALAVLARETNFTIEKLFYMPLFKSQWLSEKLRQYCIYSVWVKN